MFVVTVNLKCGESFTITCKYLELVIQYVEAVIGDDMAGWEARAL